MMMPSPLAAQGDAQPADLPPVFSPVEILPWPAWLVALMSAGALLLLAGLLAWAAWLWRRRPETPPLTPRELALRELGALRDAVHVTEPYAFSDRVSDVLRTYVERQYGFLAKKQTSPEFLAAIREAKEFTDKDRELLAQFLDRCDMLKFAHIEAHHEENLELHSRAAAFVQGARA
jgi:hypothetical protein